VATTEAAGGEQAEKIIDPISQFVIHKYIDFGALSFTNSALWALIAVGLIACNQQQKISMASLII
jgi:hypothetical protein